MSVHSNGLNLGRQPNIKVGYSLNFGIIVRLLLDKFN